MLGHTRCADLLSCVGCAVLSCSQVRIILTRPSHKLPTFEPPSKGKAVAAYVPQYGHPRDENWYGMALMLTPV